MAVLEVNIAGGSQQVREPWVWRLCHEFPIKVTIRQATVSDDYGALVLELDGPLEELQRATAWLMTTGLSVESMQRAMGA